MLALEEAAELSRHDEVAARLVSLRYRSGMSHQEAADSLGIGRRAADRLWALARTTGNSSDSPSPEKKIVPSVQRSTVFR